MKKIITLILIAVAFAMAKCELTNNYFNLRTYICPAMDYEKTTIKNVTIIVGIDYINVTKVKTDNTKKITVYRDTKIVDEYNDEFDMVFKTDSHYTELSLFEIFEVLKHDYFYND
jgi:hypothetical protein